MMMATTTSRFIQKDISGRGNNRSDLLLHNKPTVFADDTSRANTNAAVVRSGSVRSRSCRWYYYGHYRWLRVLAPAAVIVFFSSCLLLLDVVFQVVDVVRAHDDNKKEATSTCPSHSENPIVVENRLPGNPSIEWDINGAGDPTIQGFATDSSVNAGDAIHFKIRIVIATDDASGSKYRADIYRLGYYNGMGARRVDRLRPALDSSHKQPDCRYDPATHEVNCDNWDISLSWRVPHNATSGLYFARLTREDNDDNGDAVEQGGENEIPKNNWRVDNSQISWDVRFSRPKQEQDPRQPPPVTTSGKHGYGALGRGKMRNALLEPRASHIYFVVRNDDRLSDILVQTMDTTYHAYNCWGSINTYGSPCNVPGLHAGSPQYQQQQNQNQTTDGSNSTSPLPTPPPPPRAYRVSLNRPIATRAYRAVNMPLNSEYPLIRWLERNGYDVTYWSGIDTHRFGHKLYTSSSSTTRPPCKLFVSQGHDEYWSKEQREHVTMARDVAGIHLAFFSGNEIYWKIRWEDDFRTMVVYKDSQETKQIDPVEWTGTWRDDRPINTFGAKPENELSGTIFTVNAWRHDALEVPVKYSRHRFWRHTKVADMSSRGTEKIVLLSGLLGHEWDEDIDNGFRPAGLARLSETTIDGVQYLMDEGSVFDSGTATHHLVMYRQPESGSLVFGAGTCQWSWGLDNEHDSATGVPAERSNAFTIRVGRDQQGPDITVQQATVNYFADAHIFAATLQDDLVDAEPSKDTVAPSSQVTECMVTNNEAASSRGISEASMIHCKGVASDTGGGVVAAVEVAVVSTTTQDDDDLDAMHWHPADIELLNTTTFFEYVITTTTAADDAAMYVVSRAVDDSGNLEVPTYRFGPVHYLNS